MQKDKIVIFSDLLCPFCMDYVPDVINYVNKIKIKVALYYYHFHCLNNSSSSSTLSKLIDG